MLATSTPAVKKRKKTSSPLLSKVPKKKKRKSVAKTPVPELIICADQLKSDIVKKEEEKYEPVFQPALNVKIEPIIFEEIDVKPDQIKIKKKKKKRKSEINAEEEKYEPVFQPALNLKIEPIIFEEIDVKPDQIIVKKKKKKRKSEIIVEKQLIAEDNSELHANVLNKEDTPEPEVLIKSEPATPEKPSLKIEPAEFTSLFNSNIKQELEEVDDAVDEHVCKKLSFNLSDSCIVQYDTTLHCAIPPFFINSIKNGIKSQLKTLHLKYLESEQGVLLRYTNIKFKERAARIVSISPELHFDISCTVTVFRPKMGAILEGTVVKIGPGYVNCLVFGYFTAVVYDRFTNPVEVGSVIRFKLAFYQVTVHNDFILKGSPVT